MVQKNQINDDCCAVSFDNADGKTMKMILFLVLFLNFGMFLVEAVHGLIAHSNALLADSLDMLGDAFVYGISIAVLSKHPSIRAKGSLVKGMTMIGLGLFVVGENVFKIINPVVPVAETMTIIGLLALSANTASFMLLLKYRTKDLNVRSAWICSRNDIAANLGVIIAGFFVARFRSMWPDVMVGFLIAFVVLQSALRIIKESLGHYAAHVTE